MHFLFLIASLFTTQSHAAVINCDWVTEDGIRQPGSAAVIDDNELLIDVVTGTSRMTVLGKDLIDPAHAPEIAFNRAKECRITPDNFADGSAFYEITCASTKDVVTLLAKLFVNQKSAQYRGHISSPGHTGVGFIYDFDFCH